MASFDVSGKLIEKYDVQQIKETFKKREFVVECPKEINGNVYHDYLKFQLTQDRCSLIDNMNEGDMMKVHFNLRGSKWNKQDGTIGYITNLEAWRLEAQAAAAPSAPSAASAPKTDANIVTPPAAPAGGGDDSDLPF